VKAPIRAFSHQGCEAEVPPRVRYAKPGKFGVNVIHRFAATRCCDGLRLPHSVGHDGAL
jgi:hypothetical protein